MAKKCITCNTDKAKEWRKSGSQCRSCYTKNLYQKNKEQIRVKRSGNKETLREKALEYYYAHRELSIEKCKKYREANSEKIKAYNHKYKKNNRSSINKRRADRRLTDSAYRLIENLRARISGVINRNLPIGPTKDLIGCSRQEFLDHLASLFQTGMSWDNYGYYGWHVDHKRPLSTFDLSDPAQIKQANHYTNLQPLWAIDNIKKGAKHG